MQNKDLKTIIAKLRLKELEVIEKISTPGDDLIIRAITDPQTQSFIAVNGDWEKVSGYTSAECIGENWLSFTCPSEREVMTNRRSNEINTDSDESFDEFEFNLISKDGQKIFSKWKSKYYKDINATVSIGRINKNILKK